MPNLNHKSKSKEDFKPHIALTGLDVNGGAANEHNLTCIMKANLGIKGELDLLKRLGKATPEAVEKASYRNLQKQLEAALIEKTKPFDDECYHWVWIQDFDDSTVIFEVKDKSYSIGFTVSEMGIVELKDEEAVEVIRQDVYVKIDGSELILKGAEEAEEEGEDPKEEDPDDNTESEVPEGDAIGAEPSDIVNENNEDIMSQENEVVMTEEQKIELAVEKALEKERGRVALEAATEETKEIVKGFGIAEDADIEVLVKSLVGNEDLASVICKAFEAKDAELAEAKAEVEVIKAKFGEKDQVADDSNPAEIAKGSESADKAARMERIKKAKA